MSWITDLGDFLKNFRAFEIVDEGQVGLHLRKGVVLKREIKYRGEALKDILTEERKIAEECGGNKKFIIPFKKAPKMPEGYGRKFTTGLPRHPKRYLKDVNLHPGFYMCIPVIDSIYTDHNQERRIVSKAEDMPIVPISDGGNIALGFVMRQKISDYYTAYTCGDDYEDLLRGDASSIISKLASGKTKAEWSKANLYKDISTMALEKLNEHTHERWGVSVSSLSLTQIIINPTIIVGYGLGPQQTSSYVGGSLGSSNPAQR
jgi:regulator of protease activity HflC (stomatin/prohibitin superfamily)